MMALFLDTSASFLTIALLENNKVIDYIDKRSNNDLSVYTVNSINEMLLKNNVKPQDIKEIYCVNGPGSFTGIRVGVTIAKVFGWLNNIKICPVSSLYAMSCSLKKDIYSVPLIDARRGYVYAGVYKNNDCVLSDRYISLEELIKYVNTLEGIKVYISNDAFKNIEVLEYIPNIENIINNIKKEEVDANLFIPNYLKKTEAEENLEKIDNSDK